MADVKNTTTIFVAVAKPFSGNSAKKDKNGHMPMVLDPYCGTSPRTLNVLSGTVFKGQAFEVGKKYEVKAVHMGQAPSTVNPDRIVESFNFSNMGEISSSEAREWRRDEGLDYLIAPEQDEEYQEIGASTEQVDTTTVKNKI
jgi:hypothetical protein